MTPSRTRLVPLLLAVPACAALAPPVPQSFDAAAILGRFQVPVLMTFEKAPQGHPWPTQLDILGEEALQGVGRWDVSGNRAEVEALRRHLALPQAHWVVAGQGGRVLGSGSGPLGLSALKELLQASGFVSPVQALRTFLKRVPDHLEARERLLHLLRQQAGALTRARLGPDAFLGAKATPGKGPAALQVGLPKAGLVLKGEDDLRIWGPVYQELERLYASEDWLVLDHRAFIRGELAEAASPLMRSLLRRHRPTLLARLRETPQDTNLLTHWAWASVVLGEPLLPVLESLPPYPPLPKGLSHVRQEWPGRAIQFALAFEMLACGDHARHGRLMLTLWQEEVAWLDHDAREAPLRRVWSTWALPGMESFLKAGTPEAADPFFEKLGGHPGALERVAEAAALAIRLGRRDVAQAWQSRPLRPVFTAADVTFPGLLVTTASQAPRLTYIRHDEGGAWTSLTGVPSLPLASKNAWDQSRAERWRAYLGWGKEDARWALVDPQGRTLLEGLEPMDPVEVGKRLQALDLKPESPWTFELPADPWLKRRLLGLELAEILGEIEALTAQNSPPIPGVPQETLDRWVTRIRTLDPLLESRLWQRPVDTSYGIGFAPARLDAPRLAAPARAWVAALELELVRRPRARSLWNLWEQWIRLIPEPDMAGFAASLQRHPLDKGPWPPDPLIEGWLRHARDWERWSKVVEVARPRWEVAMAGPAPRPESSWWTLGLPLAEALLQLGRAEEADRLLTQVLDQGMAREDALRGLGQFPVLQKRWAPEPTGR